MSPRGRPRWCCGWCSRILTTFPRAARRGRRLPTEPACAGSRSRCPRRLGVTSACPRRRVPARPPRSRRAEETGVHYVVTALREHPELAIFLTLALGFAIGRLRIGWVSLGTPGGPPPPRVVVGPPGLSAPPPWQNVF